MAEHSFAGWAFAGCSLKIPGEDSRRQWEPRIKHLLVDSSGCPLFVGVHHVGRGTPLPIN